MTRVAGFIREPPKAELHLHLEGAVSPALFGRLRRKHGFDVSGAERAGGHWRFVDLAAFLTVYAQVAIACATRRIYAIRRMIEAGLRITINTDDPGLFETTLNHENELVADAFDLSDETLTRIAANGFSHNWRPG